MKINNDELIRCGWESSSPLMVRYHDEEWGVPVHDDNKLFEFMVLDAFQAGLSWQIVLNKREGLRKAFTDFNPIKIAAFSEDRIQELREDAGIIRNQLKIRATVTNARLFLKVQEEFGSFDSYIWHFTGGKTVVNSFHRMEDIPATSPESDNMSTDLVKRGFKFVGSTICYAFMQAAGMVNDHLVTCFRHDQV